MGFETETIRLTLDRIVPLRLVTEVIKKTPKYAQIVASIREVGLVEAPVVARDKSEKGKYLLLDGHLRIEALREIGQAEVSCLVSRDDEAFTYNKRINRLAIIQEHRMIVRAIERGASEERIAKALNVNIANIRRKRNLLEGICDECVALLKDKHVAVHTFKELRKMVPLRQIEAAELMVAMGKYAANYARSLVAATPRYQLIDAEKSKAIGGLNEEQIAMMERESVSLEREFRLAEQSYGIDNLDLVLAKGYLTSLLGNARVVRYLAQYHGAMLAEFQKLADLKNTAACSPR